MCRSRARRSAAASPAARWRPPTRSSTGPSSSSTGRPGACATASWSRPPGCPRRYRCAPAPGADRRCARATPRSTPARPRYLALAPGCPVAIAEGGEGGAEMGVHHHLAPARPAAGRAPAARSPTCRSGWRLGVTAPVATAPVASRKGLTDARRLLATDVRPARRLPCRPAAAGPGAARRGLERAGRHHGSPRRGPHPRHRRNQRRTGAGTRRDRRAGRGPFAIVNPEGGPPDETPWQDLRIAPGRYYVGGVLCESAAPPRPDPTDDPAGVAARPISPTCRAPGLAEPEGKGRFALYLDVWERHVTADEDPALLESALGGPDTTTRSRTVWQVRVAPVPDGLACSDLRGTGLLGQRPRRMAAELAPPDASADPCQITGSGGYQRLENQLYRVQVHEGSGPGVTPRFLWSRENGSVVAGLDGIAVVDEAAGTAVLTVDRIGRDEELSIRRGARRRDHQHRSGAARLARPAGHRRCPDRAAGAGDVARPARRATTGGRRWGRCRSCVAGRAVPSR